MFNLQPGQGLGNTGNSLLGFGLNSSGTVIVVIPETQSYTTYGGGGGIGFIPAWKEVEPRINEDQELQEILTMILGSGILN